MPGFYPIPLVCQEHQGLVFRPPKSGLKSQLFFSEVSQTSSTIGHTFFAMQYMWLLFLLNTYFILPNVVVFVYISVS